MKNSTRSMKANFLLCDDIRSEAFGKLTLVGLYPGNKVVITRNPSVERPKDGPLAVLTQLTIICFVANGTGKHIPRASLSSPSGKVIVNTSLPEVELFVDRTSTLALQGPQFVVPEFGRYELKLTLGTKAFSFTFEIVAAESATDKKRVEKKKTRSLSPSRAKRPLRVLE